MVFYCCNRLQPAFEFKPIKWNDRRDNHKHQGHGIAEGPFQLRYFFKIHSVNRAHQSWGQKEYRRDGKNFDDLILLVTDEVERRALEMPHLRNQMRRILSERVDVAVETFEICSRTVIEPSRCALTEESQKTIDTQETFAKLSKKRCVPAKSFNSELEIEPWALLILRRGLPIK